MPLNFEQVTATTLNQAFRKSLSKLLRKGSDVDARGTKTKELMHFRVRLEQPQHRVMMFPFRRNNPFATLFETLWVLAGKNDARELKFFLPRALDFSDDDKIWRAGYGPRLRRCMGFDDMMTQAVYQDDKLNCPNVSSERIDQIKYVYETLSKDPNSRQAIMTIWDPAKECRVEKSKDFPCCNRVAWLIRDGKLHASLNIRSNDILWGFSAINVYEFTALQELLASLLGVGVGQYVHNAESFHCYVSGGFNAENNFARLRAMYGIKKSEVEWFDSEIQKYESGPILGTWAFSTSTYDDAMATLEQEYEHIVSFSRRPTNYNYLIHKALLEAENARVAMCLLYTYYMKCYEYANSGEEDCYMVQFTKEGLVETLKGWKLDKKLYTEDVFSCIYWILRRFDRQFSNGAERRYRDKMEDAMADAKWVLEQLS